MHGFATITHRGDQVVSGMAINILAAGLTVTLGRYWFDQGGQTPALSGAARFAPIDLPYAKELYDVPVIGQLYSELLSGHSLLEYVAFAAVPLAWWVLFRTRFGLRLRAVGEAPAAVDTAGISVVRMRYTALIIGGLLAGIGGTYLAVAQTAQFIPNMSAGKGFMALAALVFGKWRPWNAMAACLLFGFLDAVAIRLQGVSIGGFPIPVQAIEALPYILTVFLLAGFIGKAVAPKALGTPTSRNGNSPALHAMQKARTSGPFLLSEVSRRGAPARVGGDRSAARPDSPPAAAPWGRDGGCGDRGPRSPPPAPAAPAAAR